MTTIGATAPAIPASPQDRQRFVPSAGAPSIAKAQVLARWTGALFLVTFATSIPPVVLFYVPALSSPAYILGGTADPSLSWGVLFELVLIIANIGTAIALFPVVRWQNEVLALGYVTARLTECGFIAVGILSLLALRTLRLEAAGADSEALLVVGKSLVTIHNWTFLLGPGFVVGVGNGLMLGYLMYISRLVPRTLSVLGLVGGPLICLSGAGVVFGVIAPASMGQVIATIPEFFWELLLGLWLLVRGFNPAAVAALAARP